MISINWDTSQVNNSWYKVSFLTHFFYSFISCKTTKKLECSYTTLLCRFLKRWTLDKQASMYFCFISDICYLFYQVIVVTSNNMEVCRIDWCICQNYWGENLIRNNHSNASIVLMVTALYLSSIIQIGNKVIVLYPQNGVIFHVKFVIIETPICILQHLY